MDRVEHFKELLDHLLDTYVAKNQDYGNSFEIGLDEDGLVSLKTRLRDKFMRFSTLIDHTAAVKDEKIEDTLLDMANYCIMGVMWLQKHEANND